MSGFSGWQARKQFKRWWEPEGQFLELSREELASIAWVNGAYAERHPSPSLAAFPPWHQALNPTKEEALAAFHGIRSGANDTREQGQDLMTILAVIRAHYGA